jgi:hypothetical protein
VEVVLFAAAVAVFAAEGRLAVPEPVVIVRQPVMIRPARSTAINDPLKRRISFESLFFIL